MHRIYPGFFQLWIVMLLHCFQKQQGQHLQTVFLAKTNVKKKHYKCCPYHGFKENFTEGWGLVLLFIQAIPNIHVAFLDISCSYELFEITSLLETISLNQHFSYIFTLTALLMQHYQPSLYALLVCLKSTSESQFFFCNWITFHL